MKESLKNKPLLAAFIGSAAMYMIVFMYRAPVFILNDDVAIESILSGAYTGTPDMHTEVHIVYRRTEAELPARAEEVAHAKEEGVIFDLLANPVEILTDENQWVNGIRCIRMELGEPDDSGRRRPVPV